MSTQPTPRVVSHTTPLVGFVHKPNNSYGHIATMNERSSGGFAHKKKFEVLDTPLNHQKKFKSGVWKNGGKKGVGSWLGDPPLLSGMHVGSVAPLGACSV
jgi:hypothetical protein